jgi:hypothetical protein
MKNSKSLYWIVTALMAAFMLMASIPDVRRASQAVSIFGHLGYPTYLLPFLGTAKILGVVAVLVPIFRRLKEWAYAGLVFDLTGALYSHLSVGDPPSVWAFPLIGLLFVVGSYLLHRQQPNDERDASTARVVSAHAAWRTRGCERGCGVEMNDAREVCQR